MPIPRPRAPGRLRLPRRTARMRLTALYGAAFLICGVGSAAVLGVTFLLYWLTAHRTQLGLPSQSGGQVLRTPIADVRQAGRYDLFRIPAANVKQVGRYDVLLVPTPLTKDPAPTATHPGVAQARSRSRVSQLTLDRQQLLIASVISLAVIVVAAAAIGWLLAGRVLRPLSTITGAARRISASRLHERLALRGPDDELKELADTLDELFARLEASFDAQRRFAANASHELRTPLTRERTLLQVTRADPAATTGTWQAVSQELLASNVEQERLLEALLTLASSEAGTGEREPVDLAAVTSATLAAAARNQPPRPECPRLHPARRHRRRPAPGSAAGDQLIDNAVRHNIPAGISRSLPGPTTVAPSCP